MKRLIVYGLSLSMLFAGCGQPAAPVAESVVEESVTEATPTEEPTPEPTAEPTAEPTPEATPEPTPEPTPTPEPEGTYTWEGTTVDDDVLYKKPYLTVENMDIKAESGPITLSVTGMQIATVIFHDEFDASIAELKVEQEATMVTIDIEAENTSDEEIGFSIFTTMTTNTHEQVHDSAHGDLFDGTFYGPVKQSGMLVYYLPNSKPEEVTQMNFIFDAPYDVSTMDSLGDEIRFTINTADYEGL